MSTESLARRFVAGLLLLVTALAAHAQLIDDVEWRRDGADAVLQVTFAVPIQFQRASIAASGDLAQAFYDLRPRGDLPASLAADRRVAPSDGLPGVSISDDPVGTLLSRKLVIRFDRKIAFRVRAGRGNCCIDVVVPGAGAAVDARTSAAPALVAEDRFLITLQQSTDPNLRMEMPVPAELQAYQLFTARRVVDSRTVYEINLGYFTTRAEAERAKRVLATRFPQAKVVELTQQPPPAAMAAVREPQPAPTPPAAVPMPAPPPVPVVPVTPGTPEAAPPPAPS